MTCSCNLWVSPILQIALFSLCSSTSIFIRTQHEYSYSDPVKAKWFLSKYSVMFSIFFSMQVSHAGLERGSMCLVFVFFLQKCFKSFVLFSQSWLLISSGALQLERWWKFGVKKPRQAPTPDCQCGSAVVCRSLSTVPVPVVVTAGASLGLSVPGLCSAGRARCAGLGLLPQPCPGHCTPGLKLGAVLLGANPGRTANKKMH